MLSYQHIYHAGNLADVHKHALLAWTLDYLTRKDKPLSYIETHAGRALYDLKSEEALKTGEAAVGISKADALFAPDHPYIHVLHGLRAEFGPDAYPGSPMLAGQLLREDDAIHLADLHPGEHAALDLAMSGTGARCHLKDGFELAHSLIPPMPKRGILVIDPSYEVKSDYIDIPRHIARINRAWNVGIIFLWYPILINGAHAPMLQALEGAHPEALRHEVRFAPARPGHGMVGSGVFVIRAPYGMEAETHRLDQIFAQIP